MDVKKALVVEGGAMRGVFSTGVLDKFLEENFNPYDIAIGVSAGGTNLAAWKSDQKGRNLKVYTDYSCRKEFISIKKFIFGGHLMDLDWLWDITIKELRLDLESFNRNSTELFIVTTNANNGKAVYNVASGENLEKLVKASSALPIFYREYPDFNGVSMSDGGVADSIPVRKAYELGANDITVVLSQPSGFRKKVKPLNRLVKIALKSRPELLKAMANRSRIYNESLDFIENPPKNCTIRVISPDNSFEVGRLTQNSNKLIHGYNMGVDFGSTFIKENPSLEMR